MSVIIKGIEMPKDGERLCIDIHPDGKVSYNLDLERKQVATAASILPHGRLIDADVVTLLAMEDIYEWESVGCDRDAYRAFLANYIEDAPTIIEAEEGK